jgi:hypothetical protein
MIGATFSQAHYDLYRETGNKNLFEEVLDKLVMDEHLDLDQDVKDYIMSEDIREDKRIYILSELLKENSLEVVNSFKKLRDCNTRTQHLDEALLTLKKYIKVGQQEVKKYGEVFTPLSLVKEMVDTLPKEVWSNPNLKWLDPANGMGNFPLIVIYKLMKGLKNWENDAEKRYKHIIENMIYVCELQPRNAFMYLSLVDPKDNLDVNLYCGSFLDEGFDTHMKKVWNIEKFDIVMGNPPYQETDSNGKSKPGGTNLYVKFIKKIINFTDYLLFLTPQSWMAPGNENSVNKFFFKDVFLQNNILYVESGCSEKHFEGVGSKFSSFLLQVGDKKETTTLLKTLIDNKVVIGDINLDRIKNLSFLPTLLSKECFSIYDKTIFSFTDKLKFVLNLEYDIRRNKDVRQPEEEYIYPVYNTGVQVRYSNFKTSYHDKKKVIISGSGNLNPIYDDGVYATSNNTLHMIVDSDKEGNKIVSLLNSKLYKFLLKYSKYSGFFTKEVLWSLPNVDLEEINDINLYKYFKITEEEVALIENTIK